MYIYTYKTCTSARVKASENGCPCKVCILEKPFSSMFSHLIIAVRNSRFILCAYTPVIHR